ncbi:hypothetical protein [Brevibacterium aurantiacum]|uniref:Lipoprotein n=1 Tax=Brevibacterium aurantiacum TaxID=273384 RepID=A0A556CC69_BREAU|nr:hypothetical protein [Brevibacterium aurantiacum]TSI14906.1 hypothetical protein FO013_12730 [Brevibacterium aurantiacum]
MKPPHPIRLVAVVGVTSALLLSGCQSHKDQIAEEPPASTSPTEKVLQSPTPSATATPTAGSYTDPSKADTYCGAIGGLVALNDEANAQDEKTIIDEMGTRLDLLVTGTAHISKLAPEGAAQDWEAVSNDYGKAADLFKSSGGQVSNTNFLLLLSAATKTADKTYKDQAEPVDDECGIDITELIAEEK